MASKVFVGMSGGVDSSVTASLLVEQGYDVVGVYMKNWAEDLPGMRCPWADDVADAKRVAVGLGIDFQVFDFQKEYKQKVVDYMVAEYRLGRTPNPDIMCNQEVKFKLFLETALQQGADFIATGHYAQTSGGKLMRAVDEGKDQTYFLYRVSSGALKRTIFPLGGYTKLQVRDMARERGLWTADKKESMGICFVGQIGIKEFLSEFVETLPGDIIDAQTNKVVGRHDGAIFYTLGQRHGLDIGGGLPYYVVGKNMELNAVYVSRRLDDERLWRDKLVLIDIHWINQAPPEGRCQIRTRHRAKLIDATLSGLGDEIELVLDSPERAITPGQSVVIYDGKEVLGGGVIKTD